MDRKLGGLILCFAAATSTAQVKENVDRFTGERIFEYVSPAKMQLAKLNFSIFAKDSASAPFFAMRFLYSPPIGRYGAQSATYIGCNRIDWLVDGQPLQLGMVRHDLKFIDRTTIELLMQAATVDQMARIGRAQTVEYRACGSAEGSLTQDDIRAAAEIAAKFQRPVENEPKIPISPPPAMKYQPKF